MSTLFLSVLLIYHLFVFVVLYLFMFTGVRWSVNPMRHENAVSCILFSLCLRQATKLACLCFSDVSMFSHDGKLHHEVNIVQHSCPCKNNL